MVVEQACSVFAECGMLAGKMIHAFGQRQSLSFAGDEIVQIDIDIAFDIRGPGDALAVRRKIASADFPLVPGEPGNLLGRNVQQADIFVTIGSIRSDQQLLTIGREIIGGVKLFAIMRSQQGTLARRDLGHENI